MHFIHNVCNNGLTAECYVCKLLLSIVALGAPPPYCTPSGYAHGSSTQTGGRAGLILGRFFKVGQESFTGVGGLDKERNDDRNDAAVCSRIDILLHCFVISAAASAARS